MRYIYLLLITFIFAACGNQKVRFIRTKATKQKVVEIADVPELVSNSSTAAQTVVRSDDQQFAEAVTQSTTETVESDIYAVSTQEDETSSSSKTFVAPLPNTVTDTTEISAQDVDYITQEAMRAEKNGTWSFITSLMTPALIVISLILMVFSILGGLGQFGVILFIVAVLLAIASFVMSIILGTRSLKAPYNTPKGRRRAIAGIIISAVFASLFLINIGLGLL